MLKGDVRRMCSSVCLLSGWLIPPRPHVVGDALADLVAVVKISLAHRSGLSARQPVAARHVGEVEEGGGEIQEKSTILRGKTNQREQGEMEKRRRERERGTGGG